MLDSQHDDPSIRGRLAEIELAGLDVQRELGEHRRDDVRVEGLEVELAADHELERPGERRVVLAALGEHAADPRVALREVHEPDGLPVAGDLLHPVEEVPDRGGLAPPLVAEPQEQRARGRGVVGDEGHVQRAQVLEGGLELGVEDVVGLAAIGPRDLRRLEHAQLLQRRVAHLVDAHPLLAGQHLLLAADELDLGARRGGADERALGVVEHLLPAGLPAGPAVLGVAVREDREALLDEERAEVLLPVSHDDAPTCSLFRELRCHFATFVLRECALSNLNRGCQISLSSFLLESR